MVYGWLKMSWITFASMLSTLWVSMAAMWLVPLTAFTAVIVVIAFAAGSYREKCCANMGAFAVLSGLMIGVFCAAMTTVLRILRSDFDRCISLWVLGVGKPRLCPDVQVFLVHLAGFFVDLELRSFIFEIR